MKYSVNDYAKALDGSLANPKADHAVIAKNFLALVRRNHDEGQLRKILDEASRLSRGKSGTRELTIESARKLANPQEKILEKFMKSGDAVTWKIDPGLIAGVKITVNDEMQFDGSMKAKLDALFGNS